MSDEDEMSKDSGKLTNNHDIKVEALSDTLAVPLIRQVGETNITRQLSADDVLVFNYATRRGYSRCDVRNLLILKSNRIHGRGWLASGWLRRGIDRGAVRCYRKQTS